VRAERSYRLAVERAAELQAIEDARGVRPHVDPAADLGERGRLLVHVDVEAGAMQRHRRGEPAEAGADDRDPERCDGRHDDATV
jgi:hypothetical protein